MSHKPVKSLDSSMDQIEFFATGSIRDINTYAHQLMPATSSRIRSAVKYNFHLFASQDLPQSENENVRLTYLFNI